MTQQFLLSMPAISGLFACNPQLKAGEWVCPADPEAGALAAPTDPISVPWSTGFEARFCEYTQAAGYCFGDAEASFEIVTAPVHSGRYAAAFTIDAENPLATQTRCVRRGRLPQTAYYEAWYFVPPGSGPVTGNWNLWYFEGGADEKSQNPLWNVSLVTGANGALALAAYSPLDGGQHYPTKRTVPIPLGAWFHITLFLDRASDGSGHVSLYQDDQLLFDQARIVTDDASGSPFGQWYVGNLASLHGLTPPESTLYVDDVSVSAAR